MSVRTPIPRRLFVAGGRFGERLPAQRVVTAIAAGVREAGAPDPDVLALEHSNASSEDVRAQLDACGFDARMRAARAVVIAWRHLEERTLAGSAAFEIATRARQGGVPTYAIAAENALDSFDARILDLQLILRGRSERALTDAGRRLAQIA